MADIRRAPTKDFGPVTPIIDRGGRRLRHYERKRPGSPGARLRREMLALGQRWCRDCAAWLPAECVTKNALCQPHENARARAAYAANPEPYRQRTRARKRLRLHPPAEAAADLRRLFDGRCAYCPAPADTWDHVRPLRRGGRTTPGNVVPACRSCNASKGAKPLATWIAGRASGCHPELFDALIHAAR